MGKLILPPRDTAPPITTLIVPRAPSPMAPLAAGAPTDSLLLRQLRLFVGEVMRMLDGYAAAGIETDDERDSALRAAQDACEVLAREIASQTMEISRIGSPADRAAIDELRYLKAAIADELLLSCDWPGRRRFTECLIETRLFGSSIAGDEVLRRIDALLDDNTGLPSQMAPLYLFAISIGFEGRHRGPGAEQALQPLRDALFRQIYRREPELQGDLAGQPRIAGRVLSPQAYQHTLSDIAPVRFFRISRATLVFLLTMAVLLALSQLAWRWSSAPVRRALEPAAPVKLQQAAPNEAGRG